MKWNNRNVVNKVILKGCKYDPDISPLPQGWVYQIWKNGGWYPVKYSIDNKGCLQLYLCSSYPIFGSRNLTYITLIYESMSRYWMMGDIVSSKSNDYEIVIKKGKDFSDIV